MTSEPRRRQTLCVMGLGYIGLPTASMFATHGFDVLGVDVRPEVVETLNRGAIHIEEPGLATLFEAAVKSGRLRAATSPAPADAFIIAVPTPTHPDHSADVTYIEQACDAILPHLRSGNLVILESTSPPGTTANLVTPRLERSGLRGGVDFFAAHSPERVLPGQILRELIENDRIVGGINEESARRARDLYAAFVQGQILLTDATTAEMTKLMENTFRDVNIALANELARICERLGISAWDVIRFANRHPRVKLHTPGPGVGGHCIAVDPWFIVEAAPEEARMIHLARQINDSQPHRVVRAILGWVERLAAEGPRPVRLALLGLTYKPDVDDMRESPSVEIALELERHAAQGAPLELRVCDPHVKSWKGQAPLLPLDTALEGADLLVLLTHHREFARIEPAALRSRMRAGGVFDTRNQFDAAAFEAAGLRVQTLGRGTPRGE